MNYPWAQTEKEINCKIPTEWEPGDLLVKESDINGPQYIYSGMNLTIIAMPDESMDDSCQLEIEKDTLFRKISSVAMNFNLIFNDNLKKLWDAKLITDSESLKLFKLYHSSERENRKLATSIIYAKLKKHVDLQQS